MEERIAELERKVAELQLEVALLKVRPWVQLVPYPQPQPFQPYPYPVFPPPWGQTWISSGSGAGVSNPGFEDCTVTRAGNVTLTGGVE